MAQTRRPRRRKHRGTQSGRIDRRPARGRPRNRAEARARAGQRRRKPEPRQAGPPTWGSAFRKSLIAGALFFGLLVVAFGREPLPSAAIAVLMLGFYVPMSFLVDRFFYQRRLRQEEKERLERAQRRTGE
jgi:hypothetical protein